MSPPHRWTASEEKVEGKRECRRKIHNTFVFIGFAGRFFPLDPNFRGLVRNVFGELLLSLTFPLSLFLLSSPHGLISLHLDTPLPSSPFRVTPPAPPPLLSPPFYVLL